MQKVIHMRALQIHFKTFEQPAVKKDPLGTYSVQQVKSRRITRDDTNHGDIEDGPTRPRRVDDHQPQG